MAKLDRSVFTIEMAERWILLSARFNLERELHEMRGENKRLLDRIARLKIAVRQKNTSAPEVVMSGILPAQLSWVKGTISEFKQWRRIPPCVYFLIDRGSIVYIGQSVNLQFRAVEHSSEKLFDRVLYLPVPQEKLNEVEAAFIRALKPKYNRSMGNLKKDFRTVLKRFGWSERDIKEQPSLSEGKRLCLVR